MKRREEKRREEKRREEKRREEKRREEKNIGDKWSPTKRSGLSLVNERERKHRIQ